MCLAASNLLQNQKHPFLKPPTVKFTVHHATSRYLFNSARMEVISGMRTLKDPEVDGVRTICEKCIPKFDRKLSKGFVRTTRATLYWMLAYLS